MLIICYPCPLTVACKLTSGVCVLELSDVREFAEDKEDKTSETGATPSDESISSKSLQKGVNGLESMYLYIYIYVYVANGLWALLALIFVNASACANATGSLLHIFDLLFATSTILLLAQCCQFGLLALQLSLAIHFDMVGVATSACRRGEEVSPVVVVVVLGAAATSGILNNNYNYNKCSLGCNKTMTNTHNKF